MHFLEANDKNQTFEKGLNSIDNLILTQLILLKLYTTLRLTELTTLRHTELPTLRHTELVECMDEVFRSQKPSTHPKAPVLMG